MNKRLLVLPALLIGVLGVMALTNAYAVSCSGYVYLTNENKFVYANATNGTNTSITEGGGSNCYQVNSAVQNMLTGIRMNKLQESNMNDFIAQQQQLHESLAEKYPYPTVEYSSAAEGMKPMIAYQQRSELEQNRADYIASTTDVHLSVLEMEMQMLHQQRVNIDQINETQALDPWTSNWSINPMENFTDNNAVAHPTKMNQIVLKPEFKMYPTGYDNSTAQIKNWADLQKWMTEHPSK